MPLPATNDPADSPFWQATLRSQLAIQKCEGCQRLRFPPRPMCPHCRSFKHEWTALSGAARVWSFAMPQSPLLPSFEKLTPYYVVLAQVIEDPAIRIVGTLLSPQGDMTGIDTARLVIGAKLHVAFKRYAPDVALPCWVLEQE